MKLLLTFIVLILITLKSFAQTNEIVDDLKSAFFNWKHNVMYEFNDHYRTCSNFINFSSEAHDKNPSQIEFLAKMSFDSKNKSGVYTELYNTSEKVFTLYIDNYDTSKYIATFKNFFILSKLSKNRCDDKVFAKNIYSMVEAYNNVFE